METEKDITVADIECRIIIIENTTVDDMFLIGRTAKDTTVLGMILAGYVKVSAILVSFSMEAEIIKLSNRILIYYLKEIDLKSIHLAKKCIDTLFEKVYTIFI